MAASPTTIVPKLAMDCRTTAFTRLSQGRIDAWPLLHVVASAEGNRAILEKQSHRVARVVIANAGNDHMGRIYCRAEVVHPEAVAGLGYLVMLASRMSLTRTNR